MSITYSGCLGPCDQGANVLVYLEAGSLSRRVECRFDSALRRIRLRWRIRVGLAHGASYFFHTLHELGQACAVQEYLGRPAVQNTREQRFLERQYRQHAFFNAARPNEGD